MISDTLLEKDLLPDSLIRQGIRHLLRQRLQDENKGDAEAQQAHFMKTVAELKKSPVAIRTEAANAQHYEVPTEFYQQVLGKNLKYSCGLWSDVNLRERFDDSALDASEERMLSLTCERAELTDGLEILELGCGWGSLSLFMAARYPKSRIVGVSNSRTQKVHIDAQAKSRGLTNLEIVAADINDLGLERIFDRVVSVEMFEHMRNYEKLMSKVAGWLKPRGKLFVHIFTHKTFTYLFDAKDASDWISQHFFTGGLMPSDNLLLYFQRDLRIEKHWRVNGMHYSKTSEAWLRKMDSHRATILPLFAQIYGEPQGMKWWVYWRVFFMSCAELWGFRGGNEWFVSHYLFQKN